MALKTLKLNLEPGNWSKFMARKSDKGFLPFQQKVFERDSFTCQYCGFQAKEHQEITNIDHNYSNNRMENMVTSCILCSQCQFIDAIGTKGFGGGVFIYLPQFKQQELNALCHVLFCAITNGTGYKEIAEKVYRNLKFLSATFEKQYGEGTSYPHVFSRLFLSCKNSTGNLNIGDMLENVRLLPLINNFKSQIEDWAAAAVAEMADQE